MSETIRLDKRLVALIGCSRGEAQKYIEGGWVLVDGEVGSEVEPEQLARQNRPMTFNNWPLPKAKVSRQSETRLRFALKSVRPEQIAFMCNSVGLSVVAMKRIRIGRVSMGKLLPGQWRYLPLGKLF